MGEENSRLNVKSIMDRGKEKEERASFNAIEHAIFSSYESAYNDERKDDFDFYTDARDIEQKERAKSLGFFRDQASWIHFLHKNVDFTINETRFKGKDSYQVRGGVVKIGDGLVLDMNSVTLIGLKDNKAYTPKQENVQFVYYSKSMNKVYDGEVRTKAMTRAYAENASEDVFSSDHIPKLEGIFHDLEVNVAPDMKIKGGNVTITEEGMTFEDSTLVREKDGKEAETAFEGSLKEAENYIRDTNLYLTDRSDEERPESISTWEYMKAFVTEDHSGEAGKRLDWVLNVLEAIFDGKQVETLTDEQKDEMGIKKLSDAKVKDMEMQFPIFPWLNGYISLTPEFNVGVDLGFDLSIKNEEEIKEKGKDLVNKIIEKRMDQKEEAGQKEQEAKKMMMQFLAVVEFDAGVYLALKGSFLAKAGLGVIAGLGNLISARSGLYAQLKLSGTQGEDDELLKGEISSNLNIKGIYDNGIVKEIMKNGFRVKFGGGIGISAQIGGLIALESEVFQWKKEWNKDFVGWDLAQINYEKEAVHEPGTSLFDIQFVQSALSAKVLHKSMCRERNEGGFTFSKETMKLNDLLDRSEKETKEAKEILDAFSKLGLKKPEEITPEELAKVKEALIFKESNHINRQNELQNKKEAQERDIDHNVKEQEKYMAKHYDRKEHMQSWKEKKEAENPGEALAGEEAFQEYYALTNGAAGMTEEVKKTVHNRAEANIAKRLELLEYEKERNQQLRERYETHIAFIKEYIRAGNDPNQATEDFADQYTRIAGGTITHVLSKYASVEQLKEYEQGRTDKIGEKHRTRLALLKEKAEKLGITEKMKEKNPEFLKFYKEETKARRILEDPFAIKIDIDSLISMEIDLLDQEKTRDYFKLYENLKEIMENYPNTTEEQKKELDEKARGLMFGGGLYTFEEYKKYNYKSLSVDDLIAYEMQKTDEDQANLLNLMNEGNTKQLLKSVDRDGVLNYFFSNQNRKEIIRKNAEIRTLIWYELDRYRYYSNDGTRKNQDSDNHLNRFHVLMNQYNLAMNFDETEEDKKQKLFDQIRDDYFNGAIDGQGTMITTKDSEKENMGFLDIAASGKRDDIKYVDRSVTQALVEKALTMSQGIGKRAHYNDLMKLQELKEKNMSDSEIWAVYQDRGGGKGFKEKYKKDHAEERQEDLSAPQLYRYVENRLGKKTRENWFGRQKMRLVNALRTKAQGEEGSVQEFVSQVFKNEAASEEEFAALLENGGLQRLRKLTALKDDEEFQHLGPQERAEKLSAFYKNKLMGDRTIKDYYKTHIEEYLTPEIIMQYEESRFQEKTAKHQERLKLLGDTSKTEDQRAREYRQMAVSDGEGMKDKFNYAWSLLYRNYETGADKALKKKIGEVLTPASALDFENHALEEVSAKHQRRIDMLQDDRQTDQEAWERYLAMGGGGGFRQKNESRIKAENDAIMRTEYNNGNFSYDQILSYEQRKLDHYTEKRDDALAPVKRMEKELQVIASQIETIKKAIEKCHDMKKEIVKQQ